MRLTCSAAVVLAMSCIMLTQPPGFSQPKEKTRSTPVVVSWQGLVKLELSKDAPKDGYVAEGKTWEKLWKAWRGTEQVPSVNFKDAVILVALNRNPNSISILPTIDEKGDLKMTIESTAVGFINPTEGAYQFALITREGIKTIRGNEIKQE
jgi:hypothetical protein